MNKLVTLCVMLVVCGCMACHKEAYHLPPDKMEKVLSDIQIAEVAATVAVYDSVQQAPIKSNDSLAIYYAEVLAHHQITLQQFRQSLDWYREHPADLDTIYLRAMNKLGPVKKQ